MTQRTGVSFELERLALEGDELVISGFWTGVRGMRFVRPTLHVDDRRILATLEHKPWAPAENVLWKAAFPWTGGIALDADTLALAVAPQVIVPLGETATGAPAAAEIAPAPDSARARQPAVAVTPDGEPAVTAAPAPAAMPAPQPAAKPAPKPASKRAAKAAAKPPPVPEPVAVAVAKPAPVPIAKPAPAAVAEPAPAPVAKPAPAAAVAKPAPAPVAKPAPAPAPVAKPAPAPSPVAKPAPIAKAAASNGAPVAPPAVVPVDTRADELARALASTERERDRAFAQLAEALETRAAAVRTRARMEIAHEAAIEARETAESALARAKAERQEAIAQRDEALIAFRTLQRQLQAERTQADREARGKPDDDDAATPLGVRTVPAVRGVMAELQYPPRERKRRLTWLDMWVVRVLGLAAAGCVLLLLYSILRVVL